MYDVDSPVFIIIKAAIFKIKIMYLLSTGVKQLASWSLIVHAISYKCKIKVALKQMTLLTNIRIIDLSAHENL